VIPVAASLRPDGLWQMEYVGILLLHGNIPEPTTFEDFVRSLDEQWEEEHLNHTSLPANPFTVAEALSHDGVRAVSDGSEWFHTQGAFGWVVAVVDGARSAFGMEPAWNGLPNLY
jgi:hypothetical protein